VIEALGLEIRQVELVGDEARREMSGKSGMAIDCRQLARSTALIGWPVAIADAEREVRIVIEEERRDVVR